MKLSIIIVSYKTPEVLDLCLNSIRESNLHFDFEVCVVDNHSIDKTIDLLRNSYPWVKVIENRTNIGYGAANNIGINATTGSYLLFINPDTLIPRDAIEKLITYLDQHSNAGAVGPKIIRKDGRFDKACRRSFPTPEVAFYRLFGLNKLFPKSTKYNSYNYEFVSEDKEMAVDSLMGACMLIRRDVLEKIGLFDITYFLYGEDLDLCYRIKQAGWEIRYYPEVTVIHLKGESTRKNLSRSIYEFYRSMYIFHNKYYKSKTLFFMNWLIYVGIGFLFIVEILKNLIKRSERRGVASASR
jgi:GT2 family glycosyltransferase